MGQSKIDVTIGNLSFSGEGEQEWLAEQLDKVLKAVPKIEIAQPQATGSAPAASAQGVNGGFTTTLASYIRDKGGESSQVDRFLITADWLRRRGNDKLTTAAVSTALRGQRQKRLANPADCLNKNVSKGYCEKDGSGFFITPDGLTKLGHE